MDSDIKTRVTPLDELKLPQKPGQDCLVVIYSSDARELGKRHVLGAQPIQMGRGSDNTIVLENDSVSRRHCRIEKRGRAYFVQDLQSTNGTYVNDELISDYQLRRGDQIKVGDTIFKFLSGSDMEAQYHETIYKMTIVDGLTGVNNKRYLLETMEREIPRARRHERPLTLVMFDIDHFKHINDTYGHLAGDYVLKEMAQLVKNRLRPDDVLGRYGGEEFAVLLANTFSGEADHLAELVRSMIQHLAIADFDATPFNITVSIGVATHDGRMFDCPDELVAASDRGLYNAKHDGRNCVRRYVPHSAAA